MIARGGLFDLGFCRCSFCRGYGEVIRIPSYPMAVRPDRSEFPRSPGAIPRKWRPGQRAGPLPDLRRFPRYPRRVWCLPRGPPLRTVVDTHYSEQRKASGPAQGTI